MSELEQLRQEAEQLRNQIRVRSYTLLDLPIHFHTSSACKLVLDWYALGWIGEYTF